MLDQTGLAGLSKLMTGRENSDGMLQAAQPALHGNQAISI